MDTCITDPLAALTAEQNARDAALLKQTTYCGPRFESTVLPFTLDIAAGELRPEDETVLAALEKEGARIAIESLASLASNANDIDHLGGGLELIPALLMTLSTISRGTSRSRTATRASDTTRRSPRSGSSTAGA